MVGWRGDLQVVRPASAVLAELDLLDGRPEVAIARLLPLLDRCGIEECDVTMLLPVLAWAHLEQGQVDQAAETVAQALTRARREDMRLIVVEALRVAAIVALCQGHRQEAAGRIEEGLELARAMPYPYAEARLLQVDGERLAAQGEPIGARKRLEEALAIFRRLGAYRETEQVERVIAAFRVG